MKRVLVGVVVGLLAVGARADVVTSVVSPLGSGGVPEDNAGQTNFCGPDAQTNVEIGSCSSNANGGTGGNAVALGGGATNSGNAAGAIAIGLNATNSGNASSNICIGFSCLNANTTAPGVGIGPSVSMGTGSSNVALGPSATHTGNGSAFVCVGASATCGERGTALGTGTTATGGTALGAGATAGVNQFVVGSSNTANTVITNAYFGSGVTNAAPTAITTLRTTGGVGTDIAASATGLAAGISTGAGAPADLRLRSTTIGSTGTTAQAETDRLWIEGGFRALTDATATTVFTVTTGNDVACSGTAEITVEAQDVANVQATRAIVSWAAVDATAGAGGEACSSGLIGTNVSAASSGTLTVTTDATTGTDLCNIRVTATGSLTETVGPRARYQVRMDPGSSTCAINPQ